MFLCKVVRYLLKDFPCIYRYFLPNSTSDAGRTHALLPVPVNIRWPICVTLYLHHLFYTSLAIRSPPMSHQALGVRVTYRLDFSGSEEPLIHHSFFLHFCREESIKP